MIRDFVSNDFRCLVENWDEPKEDLIPASSTQEEEQPTTTTKKSKKKSKLRQAIAQAKPTFDPSSICIHQNQSFCFCFQKRKPSNNISMNIINSIARISSAIHQFDFNIDKSNRMISV